MALYHLRTALMLLSISIALVAFARMRSPRPRAFLLTGLIAVLALPTEALGYWTTLRHINNSVLYNVFTWLEFLVLLAMVHAQHPLWRNTLVGVGVLGTAVMAVIASHAGTLRVILIEGIVVMALLLALTLGALLWSVANTSVVPLHRVPVFWLFMGLLLYFGALPPVVTLARAVSDPSIATTLWTIVPMLCILRYLLTAYAYWKTERQAVHEHG